MQKKMQIVIAVLGTQIRALSGATRGRVWEKVVNCTFFVQFTPCGPALVKCYGGTLIQVASSPEQDVTKGASRRR